MKILYPVTSDFPRSQQSIREAMLVDENGQPLVDDHGQPIWPPAG
jgi:hypothetical protein